MWQHARFGAAMLSVCLVAGPAPAAPPPGFEIVVITEDEFRDAFARINNCGEVVFSKRVENASELGEIFHYDNGKLTQITDDLIRDDFPDINDAGAIVWTSNVDNSANGDVVLRSEDGIESVIGFGGGPSINNLGHVAWDLFDPTLCASPSDVWFYDGLTAKLIIHDGLSNQAVKMNDFDEITFTRYDFCAQPSWQSDIMLYSGGQLLQLTNGQANPQQPHIDSLGRVAWRWSDEFGRTHMEIWQDGQTISFAEVGATGPKLSDSGDIAYSFWDEDLGYGYPYLFTRGSHQQITAKPPTTGAQDINDYGEIPLFVNYGFPHSDIHLLRRIRTGDVDFDGVIGLADAAALPDCVTGPIETDRLCECRFLDIDNDRDVDLDDYRLFQNNMESPSTNGDTNDL